MGEIEIIDRIGTWESAAAELRRGLGLDDASGCAVAQLYDVPGVGPVNLARYAMYVCLRLADVNERHSLSLSNIIARRAELVQAESKVMEWVLSGDAALDAHVDLDGYVCQRAGESPTLREFLTLECEIPADEIRGIDTYEKRQALANRMEQSMQSALNDSEFRQADLQLAVNRIEKCLITGSNLARQLGRTGYNTAGKL